MLFLLFCQASSPKQASHDSNLSALHSENDFTFPTSTLNTARKENPFSLLRKAVSWAETHTCEFSFKNSPCGFLKTGVSTL